MTHYFNGIDRNNPEAVKMTAANLNGNLDTAELRLIGCFVPPSRRNGAIAFWTVPVLDEANQGHAVVVTARRFPDASGSIIAGENWKVIETMAKIGFFDPDGHRVVIGLPMADLKAMRQGGFDCQGFVPYKEIIRYDSQNQQYRFNGCELNIVDLVGINELLDAWEPDGAEEIEEVLEAQRARDEWVNWPAAPTLAYG